MLKHRLIATVLAITTTVIPVGARAAGYADVIDAYGRGDFVTTLRELKPMDATDARAQYLMGVMYQTGQGLRKDDREAASWYRKAADQGHADAQFSVGLFYAEGAGGLQKDERSAVEWYRKAAAQGQAKAQHGLGFMYLNGRGVAQDQQIGAEWVRKAAEHGNAEAQADLGVLYQRGAGVTKDRSLAADWFRKAADLGNVDAQARLGFAYKNGDGIVKDATAAVTWLRRAADRGDREAQKGLGVMYLEGSGVEQDDRLAVAWFQKAADQGSLGAKNNLAYLYEEGRGVVQDYAAAARLYETSARQGDAWGQRNLARLYRDGKGVKQDAVIAYAWLNLAASASEAHPKAADDRAALLAKMTSDQIAEGQRLAAEWKPGLALGKSRVKTAAIDQPDAMLARATASNTGERFPMRPDAQSGAMTCNTRCENSTCFRTYGSGKQVEYQARQKWNPLTNRFDWDAGTC